jgi:hypothetical protein
MPQNLLTFEQQGHGHRGLQQPRRGQSAHAPAREEGPGHGREGRREEDRVTRALVAQTRSQGGLKGADEGADGRACGGDHREEGEAQPELVVPRRQRGQRRDEVEGTEGEARKGTAHQPR